MDDSISPQAKQPEEAPPKKRSKARLLLMLITLVLLAGTFGVGVWLRPRFLTSMLPWLARADAAGLKKEELPAAAVALLEPIVVDLREATGERHHLKVGIAVELMGAMHGEEFKRYEPRARDAAITYLRSLSFEEVSNPKQLDSIRAALSERIGVAVGSNRVRKILFTDFVAQ